MPVIRRGTTAVAWLMPIIRRGTTAVFLFAVVAFEVVAFAVKIVV